MAGSGMPEAFTLIGGAERQETVYEDFETQQSAKIASPIVSLLASVRAHHADLTVALAIDSNVDLLAYAAAGFATADLDLSEDNVLRSRFFLRPTSHKDNGALADSTIFARYNYTWKGLKFILYAVFFYPQTYQFICFPPDSDESPRSNSKATDALLLEAGRAIWGKYQDYIAVYDGYWRADVELYKEVQKTSWDDVILDQQMKNTISHTIEEFFDNESRYRDLDVPWKRGIIFHGPPGNGKTISLRALMHSLIANERHRPRAITLLYVKSIPYMLSIRMILSFARMVAPCLLIIEDIDTQITPDKLSYFFNEVDGLENNDGILTIATTNHLDKLDEGLKRPSRFDRRYLFPLPQKGERTTYCEFWREKLAHKGAKVDFPKRLSEKIAGITEGFSFATMKEAFVATLLALARQGDDDSKHQQRQLGNEKPSAWPQDEKSGNGNDDDINKLPLWKEMQVQVKLLRDEMRKGPPQQQQQRHQRDRELDSAATRGMPHLLAPRLDPRHMADLHLGGRPGHASEAAAAASSGGDTNMGMGIIDPWRHQKSSNAAPPFPNITPGRRRFLGTFGDDHAAVDGTGSSTVLATPAGPVNLPQGWVEQQRLRRQALVDYWNTSGTS